MPSVWTRLRAAADPVLRRTAGLYTAYPLHGAEHIGTTHDLTLADARHYLRQNGYEPQYLSAAKRHPVTGALHDLSYRRVPDKHPALLVNEPLAQDYRPNACQYHAHLFRWDTGRIDWYSHYEARPDLTRPSVDLDRLRTHYRPRYGLDYFRGVTDLDI